MAKTDQEKEAAPIVAKKKSKLTLILIVVLTATTLTSGFFAWRYFAPPVTNAGAAEAPAQGTEDASASATDGESPEGEDPAAGNAIINFEPFLVNLADKDTFRYLRVTIRLAVTNKEKAESIASTEVLMSKTRDAILDILSSKASSEIISTEGKERLKAEIKERLNSFLPDSPVLELFFTDFVVQL